MLTNSFDFIRLFAALLVVYGHSYPLTGAGSPVFGGNSVQAIGVKVFFVISGYLIMSSWQRDSNVLRFAHRRALRILPGLFAVVAICVLIIGPAQSSLTFIEYFQSSRTWSYFNNILMRPQYDLPGVFSKNVYPTAVNGSLWSLPAEVAMYFIGPIAWVCGSIFFKSPRIGVSCAALSLVGLSLFYTRIFPATTPLVIYGSSVSSFLDVAPYFLLGSMYALWDLTPRLNPVIASVFWIVFSLVQFPSALTEAILYLLLPYVVLSLGLKPSFVGKWLTSKGDISYGVYLYGFPLQQVMAIAYKPAHDSPWINFLVTLVPLLLIAAISWRFVERPLLRLKPSNNQVVKSFSTQQS